jgi:hypothetical protein
VQPRAALLVLTPESLSRRPGYDEVLNDMTLMKTELGVDDYARLWYHSAGMKAYAELAGRLTLRPALYTADVKDLLLHLRPRTQKIRITYGWLKTVGNDPEALETENKYQVCDASPLPELEQAVARERAVPGSARLADLERVWAGYSIRVNQPLAIEQRQLARLERLLRSLAARIPRLYVVAAPYFDPEYSAYPREYREAFNAALHEVVSGVEGVALLPDFPTDCTMFFDTVHLNQEGGDKFTAFLQQHIGSLN